MPRKTTSPTQPIQFRLPDHITERLDALAEWLDTRSDVGHRNTRTDALKFAVLFAAKKNLEKSQK